MLKGKIALVTGGSRGIGAAVAKKLASLGADIAIIYAGSADAAEAVCSLIRKQYGVSANCYQCNVADYDAGRRTVSQIKSDFGTIDILVNNAGITKDGLIAMMKEDQFDDVIAVNLKGTFNMIKHCTGIFIRQRSGAIINMSSVTGIMGNAGQVNYAASKAGVIGLTKSIARELAPRGITCNAVAPGFIDTDMTKGLQDSPLAASIPLGRMGTAEEVAQAVAYLACASYVTGTVLQVDGGIAM
ncbi:MAG: 3-oxoacyl-[acyl-carrier-protein] reductase [Oscillospiraceae bacterium]|nr:3-oxoacyl-[acyl-carrier-protein] reductase [Oscillospiraceae bacterium]